MKQIRKFFRRILRRLELYFKLLQIRDIYNYHHNELKKHYSYKDIIGTVSQEDLKKRKDNMINAIGKLLDRKEDLGESYGFDYKENQESFMFMVAMFDRLYFTTKRSGCTETERKNICYLQALFILIMSGNFPIDQKIVIYVESFNQYSITYRIYNKLDLGGALDEFDPILSDGQDLPTVPSYV